MAVLVDTNTRLIAQGMSGKENPFHAKGWAEQDAAEKVVAAPRELPQRPHGAIG